MKPNARVVFATVMGCCFISGIAGLVYQVAWARYLSLFWGHSSYAVVAVQWIQIAETSDRTLQSMLKTFTTVFPFVSIWRSEDHDIAVVGTPAPRRVELQALLARMTDPAVHADLERGAMSEPLALLSREVLSAENGAFLSEPDTPIHSDYFSTVGLHGPSRIFVGARSTLCDTFSETHNPRVTTLLASYLKTRALTVEDFKRAAKAYLDHQFLDDRLHNEHFYPPLELICRKVREISVIR